MAGRQPADLNTRHLGNFLQSMQNQGILDTQFDQVRSMQNKEDPHFVSRLISEFFSESDTCIRDLFNLLNEPEINYGKVSESVLKLKGSSSSIGGRRVALACGKLGEASSENDDHGCVDAFKKLRDEYKMLKGCLNQFCELERRKD